MHFPGNQELQTTEGDFFAWQSENVQETARLLL